MPPILDVHYSKIQSYRMDKIEAIIICVNYSDFLGLTLKENEKHFDHIVVITDTNDKSTPEVCKPYKDKITCLATNAFYTNGAKFNKGLCINFGFQVLKHKEWIFNLDSDILLPYGFKYNFLNMSGLTGKEYFYGFRRYDIPTQEDYIEYLNGANISKYTLYRGSGYGYAAAFHYKSKTFQKMFNETNGFPYPVWFKNGSESDWVFRNAWGERVFSPPLSKFPNCHFEPENDYDTGLYKELPIRVIHLGEVGKNHNERITKKW